MSNNNPFQITTPENLSAQETMDLFVDMFNEFPNIIDPGHMFLIGPRGVGKSMMFRYLQADCQCLKKPCKFKDLSFLGIYIPIKNESFVKTEIKRSECHGNEILNEHLMITHFCVKIYNDLLKNPDALKSINAKSLLNYYNGIFTKLLAYDNIVPPTISNDSDVENILSNMIEVINKLYKAVAQYFNKLAFTKKPLEYNGSLLDYQDFLVPLISALKDVDGFPKGTIYLLIDDAHFLTLVQTRILNSWIATRTSGKISLKVSTQYDYKSYYTVTGATIDYPHDYSEIDITTVYTSNIKTRYRDRIRKIVEKRLKLQGIDIEEAKFFPEDTEQEKKINLLKENYRRLFDEGKGRGNKRDDDANRYARLDYIKSLGGHSKSRPTYSYSGFKQLVHISSGIVRYFLEAAHIMYSDEKSVLSDDSIEVTCITSGRQNKIVRSEADKFLLELEKYKNENDFVDEEDIKKLSNLINGLGELFHKILVSERSERRIFSISISDTLSAEVERILKLGVNLGYFHRSTVGRKDSAMGGRTRSYILCRRLFPIWTLDPSAFSGCLSVTNELLENGIKNPKTMLRRIDQQEDDREQISLFDDLDKNSGNYFEVIEGEEEDD